MGLFIMVGEYSFNGDSYTITSQRSYDAVCHVNLAFVHVVQHLLGAFGPDFVVTAVAEEAHADDDVAREGQALLRFHELILEAGAAAEGYDGVFAVHIALLTGRLWFIISADLHASYFVFYIQSIIVI